MSGMSNLTQRFMGNEPNAAASGNTKPSNTSTEANRGFEPVENVSRPNSSESFMASFDDDLNLRMDLPAVTGAENQEVANATKQHEFSANQPQYQKQELGNTLFSSSSNSGFQDIAHSSIHISNELEDLFLDQTTFDQGTSASNPQPQIQSRAIATRPNRSRGLISGSFTQPGSQARNTESLRRAQVSSHIHHNKAIGSNNLRVSHNGLTPDITTVTSRRSEGNFSQKHTESDIITEEDDMVVIDVQKQSSTLQPNRSNIVKMQNKYSIAKQKQSRVFSRAGQMGSDKFLEPLLVSISKLQQEKNFIQAELQELAEKYSKATSQLEKSTSITTLLKTRIGLLIKVQEEIQEDMKKLKADNNPSLQTQIAELKASSSSIAESMEQTGSTLENIHNQRKIIAEKISEVKANQAQSK